MNTKPVWVLAIVLVAVLATYELLTGKLSEEIYVKEPPLFSVGTNIWPGYEPLYLARELGFYADSNVHLVEFASATQVIHAFRNRVISAAAVTLDEVLLMKDYGLDPKVVLVFDVSHGADVILAGKEIPNVKALKGKRVGVENTALGAFVLLRALQLNQMQLSDIKVISLPVNEHDTAFELDKVDGLITFEPVRSRLMAKGYHEIFTSKDMPGEIVDVLVVNKEALTANRHELEILLKGWFKSVTYLNEFPEKAAAIMAARQKILAQEVLNSYQGLHLPSLDENIEMMAGPSPSLRVTSDRLAKMMRDAKLLKNDLNMAMLISSEPIKRLYQNSEKR